MISNYIPSLTSITGAFASLSCCVLPMALLSVGVASGSSLAAVFGPWNWLLFPLGWVGLAFGYYSFLRQRKRCQQEKCAVRGGRINLVFLGVATTMMLISGYFNWFFDAI